MSSNNGEEKTRGEKSSVDYIQLSQDRDRAKRIRKLSAVQLIDEFETLIRNGAGKDYRDLVWLRNELIRRTRVANTGDKGRHV